MSPTHEPTVEETLDALAALVVGAGGITGVVEAYGKNTPRTLAAANFPCVVWLPGQVQADWPNDESDEDGVELYLTRTYHGFLFVAPANTGAEGESFADAVPFIDRFWSFFLAHPGLGQIGPYLSRPMGDSGVRSDIPYAGMQATGIRFDLAVTSKKRVNYADYE